MTLKISQETVDAICIERQDAGTSHRKLAARHGVSRGTISLILRNPADWRAAKQKAKSQLPSNSSGLSCRTVPQYYCNGCHAFVTLRPCPACRARAAQKWKKHSFG